MIEVIKFKAEWCGPCKQLAPVMDKVMNMDEYSDVKYTDIDVDNDPDKKAELYGVKSIPVVFVEKDGEIVFKFVGVKSENDIKSILDNFM